MDEKEMSRPRPLVVAVGVTLIGLAISIPILVVNVMHAPVEYSRPVMIGAGLALGFTQLIWIALIHAGRNWARFWYVGFILVGTAVGATGPNPKGTHHEIVAIYHWFQLALGITVAVLLLMPSTTAWFRTCKSHA